MRSLSSLGVALSAVFTCLLFALIAEIYYLLWWKRRIIRREIENDYTNNPAKDLFLYMFCWHKKPLVNSTNAPQEFQFQAHNIGSNKDYLAKTLGGDDDGDGEGEDDGVLETGLISGPPRFLFTIKEETKEDLLLELEDGKLPTKRNSLSELLKNMETPYLTPLSSPPFLTPPLTPMGSCHSGSGGSNYNYNPFFEASSDAEFSKMVKCSPPPKFKFLRDAEEKLKRKTVLLEKELEAKRKDGEDLDKCCGGVEAGQDGNSFINVIVANSNKKCENDQTIHHYHSPLCLSGSSYSALPPSFNIDPRVP